MDEQADISIDLFGPFKRLITEAEYSSQFALLAESVEQNENSFKIPMPDQLVLWPFELSQPDG